MAKPLTTEHFNRALVLAFIQGAIWSNPLPFGPRAAQIAEVEALSRLVAGTLGVEG